MMVSALLYLHVYMLGSNMDNFRRPQLPPNRAARVASGMTQSTGRSEDFSTLARTEARRLSAASGPGGCWLCEEEITQICHVLAKEDRLLVRALPLVSF